MSLVQTGLFYILSNINGMKWYLPLVGIGFIRWYEITMVQTGYGWLHNDQHLCI